MITRRASVVSEPAQEEVEKTLSIEDLPALLSSPAHFARKFDIDGDARILDELGVVTG